MAGALGERGSGRTDLVRLGFAGLFGSVSSSSLRRASASLSAGMPCLTLSWATCGQVGQLQGRCVESTVDRLSPAIWPGMPWKTATVPSSVAPT